MDNFDGLLRSSMNLLENRFDPDLRGINPKRTAEVRVRRWGIEVNLTPTHCRFFKIVSSKERVKPWFLLLLKLS